MKSAAALLLALMAGCASSEGPASQPMAGGAPGFDGVRVTISVKDQQMRVEAEAGVAEVQFSDTTAHARLTGGQRLSVAFDPRSRTFAVEVLEDAAGSLDIGIGTAVVHATKGDAFDARVIGEHLEIAVRRGLVSVMSASGLKEEVGQGGEITVSGGAKGAIHGVPSAVPPSALRTRGIPKDPRRPLILDRTDIAPAP